MKICFAFLQITLIVLKLLIHFFTVKVGFEELPVLN